MTEEQQRERLRKLACEVDGSYDDFVVMMEHCCVKEGVADEMISFMEENPSARTGAIIKEFCKLVVLR